MKAYHKSCGSNKIETRQLFKNMPMSFCAHCNRFVEASEIHKTDRRISAVTFKGKAFIYGRECK